MNDHLCRVQVTLNDVWLDLSDLCQLAGVTETWVRQRMADGLLTSDNSVAMEAMRFDAGDLHRVVRMVSLERDFDAVPELASLVIDLEMELKVLRTKLQRLGGQVGHW